MKTIKKLLTALMLLTPLVSNADTPPQVINKTCSANQFLNKIAPGPGNITCGTPTTSWGAIIGTLSAQTDLQNALNAKQNTLVQGNLTEATSSVLTITGGTSAVIGTGTSILVKQSNTSQSGYLSSTDWNTFNNKQSSGNFLTALTGDVAASGPGSAVSTLATVNSNVGSFGSASASPAFTVNAKGLITAASSSSIQIAESQVTNLVSDLAGKQATGNYITALTGDATAAGPGSVAMTLATVNANTGSFGSASSSPNFTVNAKGLLTAAGSSSIQIAESQVTNLVSDLAGKQATLTIGNLTDAGTDGIVVTGGTGAIIGSGASLAQHVADSTHNGYLSSTDWSTFNNKQPAGSYITASSSDTLTNKSISGSTNTLSNIADGSLSTSYVKADGTRALSANWAAGSFSITSGSFIPSGSTVPANGLYLPAANTVAMTAGSLEGLRITNTANALTSQFFATDTAGATQGTLALDYSSGDSALRALLAGTSGKGAYYLIGENGVAVRWAIGSDSLSTVLNFRPTTASTTAAATLSAAGAFNTVGAITGSNLSGTHSGTSSGTNTGDVTLGAIGGTPNANGASLSSQVLTLQPASASFGGIVTTGTQTLPGLKSFTTGALITGVVSGSNAAAGLVGEILTHTTSLTTIANSGQFYDAESLSLTAGDWDVSCNITYTRNGATFGTTDIGTGISSTTGNSATGLSVATFAEISDSIPTTFTNVAVNSPTVQVIISGTTTYYCKGFASSFTGTPKYQAFIRARRMR